ncbi:MAG: hypothetical protein WC586_11855 [Methanoregula sp.]
MKIADGKILIVGIIAFIVVISLVWFFGIVYINNSPGVYKYTVDIEGLENYEPSLITDIIVPLPVRGDQPVFSDDELQYRTFGNWKTVLVMTRYGKMLAFESVGRNLTDIHAEFYQKYPEGTWIENITRESFSPVLPLSPSAYTGNTNGNDPAHAYSTIIYIPDTIRPLHPETDSLIFDLKLVASEGMQHSRVGRTYQVAILEKIPPDVNNMTQVVAQVSIMNS